MSSVISTSAEPDNRGVNTVTRQETVQSILELLTDPDCRTIVEATTARSLTAKELSRETHLPLSTTYRKLSELTDAGILSQGTRFGRTGSHSSEYRRLVDDVTISLSSDDGAELAISSRGRADSALGSAQL